MVLAVHVTPRSSRDEVMGWRDGVDGSRELAVRVTAAPEKGKATKAAGVALAAFFRVPKGKVTCVSGMSSRHKRYELPITEADLARVDMLGN